MNINQIRDQFPALDQKVNGHKLVYFDNAATSLKPLKVIERTEHYYRMETSNVHRGAHFLSNQATVNFENARETVRQFLNARDVSEIIWTRGTTDSVNLVAQSYAGHFLKEGDEIILSELDHHSNIVPWQIIAERNKLKIRFITLKPSGELDLEQFDSLVNEKTKLISVVHCSNAIGTIVDVERIIKKGHSVGAKVMIDAAQSVIFMPVDVQKLDCDFLAFSGHKIFGPHGIGVLYGKLDLLNSMPPYQGGGSMIDQVSVTGTTFLKSPQRFEAGTPHVSGVIGLAEAIRFVQDIGIDNIHAHEQKLTQYAISKLDELGEIEIYGPREKRGSLVSFNVEGIHSADIGPLLDEQGVAVRTGHHCTQIVMKKLGVTGTVRASFSIYNTTEEIDIFIEALRKAKSLLT